MVKLSEKYPLLNETDAILLDKAVNEIKEISGIIGVVQIGSSIYSKNYNDIDLIVFFDSFLVPPELEIVRINYKKTKLFIEGASTKYKDFNPGFKVFINFFSHLKHKKCLYGKDPFLKKKIVLKKTDVAAYIWYHWHVSEQYEKGYENALPNSMNAMLSYINVFPENKEQTLELFIKKFPFLTKYLPKNAQTFLMGVNKSNFKELYLFFENCLKYFA